MALKFSQIIPYLLELAYENYYLFTKMKSELRGKRFDSGTDVIVAVDDILGVLCSTFPFESIVKLKQRWLKCVNVMEDYVEK